MNTKYCYPTTVDTIQETVQILIGILYNFICIVENLFVLHGIVCSKTVYIFLFQ